ncbi:MAG TPA: nuclear transport factor 2 family protein [Pyrinomonadaceae bacterium]|jgi:ketosteroid isomerase-like protein
MRLPNLLLILCSVTSLFPATSSVAAPSRDRSAQKTNAQKKLEREILKAEASLGNAIVRRDAKLLERLLTDYYADAFEGSERATNKKATLNRCRNGELQFYGITEHRTISSSVDIVTIEGIGGRRGHKEGGPEKAAEVHVKRLWTKKDGRWQLVGQTIGPVEEDSEQ